MREILTKPLNVLIVGGEQSHRLDYAKKLAQYHLCQNHSTHDACNECFNCQRVASTSHPNLIVIEPEISDDSDKSLPNSDNADHGVIKIDQARRIIKESHKTNFEHGPSIFMITHMHRVTKAAANALLKVMEENTFRKIFIALAPSRMTILPTIASRLICHQIKPAPISADINKGCHERILAISKTKPGNRFPLCGQFSTDREDLLRELGDLTTTCHILLERNLLLPRFALTLLESLHQAQTNLRKNLNPRLVTEVLLFKEWPLI